MHIPLASAQRVALFKSLARFRKRGISDLRWARAVSPSAISFRLRAVDNTCHPSQQDRDEAGHRAENEGRCRCLHHHLRELTCVRHNVHVSATSIWDMATWLRRRLYSGDEIDQTAIQSPGTHLLFAKSRLPNHEPAAKGNG